MKAERRHELQTNALADWLNKTFTKLQPHANTILIGALLVVLAIVAVVMLTNRSSNRGAGAWGAYYQATVVEDDDKRITELLGVSENHPDTAAGLWARLMAGEARLVRGNNASFKDRAEGREDLDKAQMDFEAVIKGADKLSKKENSLLLQRGHWGLARTFEALAMHDEAVEQYQKLAEGWPEDALGKAAADKAEYLEGMSEWFTWYASVDPTKIKTSATREGIPDFGGGDFGTGGNSPLGPYRPPEDTALPDDDDFSLPDPLSLPGLDDLNFDDDPATTTDENTTPDASGTPDEETTEGTDSDPDSSDAGEATPDEGTTPPADTETPAEDADNAEPNASDEAPDSDVPTSDTEEADAPAGDSDTDASSEEDPQP